MCSPERVCGLSFTSAGNTSTSFTIQSESVPDVDTVSSAVSGPASVTSPSSTSLCHVSTSGRRAAKRWSPVMYSAAIPILIFS